MALSPLKLGLLSFVISSFLTIPTTARSIGDTNPILNRDAFPDPLLQPRRLITSTIVISIPDPTDVGSSTPAAAPTVSSSAPLDSAQPSNNQPSTPPGQPSVPPSGSSIVPGTPPSSNPGSHPDESKSTGPLPTPSGPVIVPSSSAAASDSPKSTPVQPASTPAGVSSSSVPSSAPVTTTVSTPPPGFFIKTASDEDGNGWTTTTEDGKPTVLPIVGGYVLHNPPKVPNVEYDFPKFPELPSFSFPCIKMFGQSVGDCTTPPSTEPAPSGGGEDNSDDDDDEEDDDDGGDNDDGDDDDDDDKTSSSSSMSSTPSTSSPSSTPCASTTVSDCKSVCSTSGTSMSCFTRTCSTIAACSATPTDSTSIVSACTLMYLDEDDFGQLDGIPGHTEAGPTSSAPAPSSSSPAQSSGSIPSPAPSPSVAPSKTTSPQASVTPNASPTPPETSPLCIPKKVSRRRSDGDMVCMCGEGLKAKTLPTLDSDDICGYTSIPSTAPTPSPTPSASPTTSYYTSSNAVNGVQQVCTDWTVIKNVGVPYTSCVGDPVSTILPYQPGTCRMHILEASEDNQHPIGFEATIYDNDDSQIGHNITYVRLGDYVYVDSELPYDVSFEPTMDMDSKKRKRTPIGIPSRPISIEHHDLVFRAGDYSWNTKDDTDDSSDSYCDVGDWDNGDFDDFVKEFLGEFGRDLGLSPADIPNRQMDCYWPC